MMRQLVRQRKLRVRSVLGAAALALLVLAAAWTYGPGLPAGKGPAAVARTADFGDWRLECAPARGSGTPEVCGIYQRIALNDGKTRVLQVTIVMDGVPGKGQAGSRPSLRVLTPLAVSLRDGVAAKLDDAPQVSLSFERCLRQGCLAAAPPGGDLVEKLRKGRKFLVGFRLVSAGKPTVIALSLKGFSGALDALEKNNAKARGL